MRLVSARHTLPPTAIQSQYPPFRSLLVYVLRYAASTPDSRLHGPSRADRTPPPPQFMQASGQAHEPSEKTMLIGD